MPQLKGEGVILRSSNLGEWDKLIVVLGQGSGKTRAVVKGARKVQNRHASLCQVFSHVRYTFYTGRSLNTLSQAELVHGYPMLRDNLDKMAYGLYLLELVESFLEDGQTHDDILSLLLATLHILSYSEKHDLLMAFFQIRFLARLGWALNPRQLPLEPQKIELLAFLWENDWQRVDELEDISVARSVTRLLDKFLSKQLGKEPKSLHFLSQIRST